MSAAKPGAPSGCSSARMRMANPRLSSSATVTSTVLRGCRSACPGTSPASLPALELSLKTATASTVQNVRGPAEIALASELVTAAMGFRDHDPMALRSRCGGKSRVPRFVG